MSGATSERLFSLLPSIYRIRDAAHGEPLRALVGVMEEELARLEADVARLYDNWFIETCDEWVIPYIGDLVGNRPLHEVVRARRADVAKTLYYRRRKATVPMLEEMARDVTGWGAHVVPFFELLNWTQHLNHLRHTPAPHGDRREPNAATRVGTVNLRATDALGRLDTAFDELAHTVDVRPTDRVQGRYNIRNIGFFLWRLRSYPLASVEPRRAAAPNAHGYHFSMFGNPAPLFVDPVRESDSAATASEIHIAAPIRPEAFAADLRAYQERYAGVPEAERPPASVFYGPGRSVNIVRDGHDVPPMDVISGELREWCRPPAGKVGVDVRRGRLVFAAGEEPERVRVDYAYGFSADIGGGPYDRRDSMISLSGEAWHVRVAKGTPVYSLQRALRLWRDAGRPRGVIQIEDNRVYGGRVVIALPENGRLVIQAANGVSPDLRLIGNLRVTAAGAGATLVLDGLQLEGGIRLGGRLDLRLQHCTVVPGRMLREDGTPVNADRDSLVATAGESARYEVTISHSIVGPIRLPSHSGPLTVHDSIIQAPRVGGVERPAIAATDPGDVPGPPITILRSTIFGAVFVPELTLASEVIFMDRVRVQRRQSGCVRFSYVPPGSRTPRRFRCQPDLALEGISDPDQQARIRSRLTPSFTSTMFGQPGYAQLAWSCADEIRTGAENGAEMGVFHHLMQPQREANLRTRLEEYLPFGLDAGFIFLT